MQNIQELMGRVSDLTDAGRSLVPYLNWSSPQLSTVLLQLSIASTIVLSVFLYIAAPYLDIRYIFLLVGECTLLSSHPVSVSLFQSYTNSPNTRLRLTRLGTVAQQMMADDALSDEVILPNKKGERRAIKEILVYENERRSLDGSWSTDAIQEEDEKPWLVLIDGQVQANPTSSFSKSAQSRGATLFSSTNSTGSASEESTSFSTIQPPRGFAWLPEEWVIDLLGLWNRPGGVDGQGWAFWDADGKSMTIDPAQKEGELKGAAKRKRKWVRRIVSVPTY